MSTDREPEDRGQTLCDLSVWWIKMLIGKLQFKEKISRRESKEMIVAFAKHGNHIQGSFATDADVKRFFAACDMDFARVVEECRDPQNAVPYLENLIQGTFNVSGRASIALVDLKTGEETALVQGPGIFVASTYQAAFEHATLARNRAVQHTSYQEFLTAVADGIASIEAYINHRARLWNKMNPAAPMHDSHKDKVSLDDKIDKWLPVLTGGKRLDKGIANWPHFKMLRDIRDETLHPKDEARSASLDDLASGVNRMRTGIAGLLMQMHILFGERVPGAIIRMAYDPDVVVVQVEDG